MCEEYSLVFHLENTVSSDLNSLWINCIALFVILYRYRFFGNNNVLRLSLDFFSRRWARLVLLTFCSRWARLSSEKYMFRHSKIEISSLKLESGLQLFFGECRERTLQSARVKTNIQL